jgi:hypothetical protein
MTDKSGGSDIFDLGSDMSDLDSLPQFSNPTGDQTYPVGQIYPTWSRICLTVPDGHGTGTRPELR